MVAILPLVGRHARVQRGAPATIDNVDVGRWVHAGHHGPKHFFLVGGIDIFVDDHDVAAIARGRGGTHGGQACLLGMASVFLLDGNHGQIGSMIVDADDVLDSGALQLIPEDTRGDMQIHLHRARPQRRFVFQDRIVAMIDRFDSDDRLFVARAQGAAGIITWPFPKWPFGARIFRGRRHFAFDGDFGRRWNRQTGERPE